MNKEFLKKITILYVEDEEGVRTQLNQSINIIFKKIYLAEDGLKGLEVFKENLDSIDIIISDINMPNMSGIEFLKEVREIDKNIPFIFLTAHTDVKFLQESIKYNATEYISKPLDIHFLIEKVSKSCVDKFATLKSRHQKEEIKRYLDAINKVAIVSKTDLNGIITYVNDIFCDISQYERDALVGENHNIVRHPDTPSETFKKLWETIKDGKTWQGKIKNKAKFGSSYFVNATILPIYDELGKDIIEYIAIRFLTTNDELEKREFKKRVVANIQENKKREIENVNHITILENKLKRYENVASVEEALNTQRKKVAKLLSQVKHYENEIVDIKKSSDKLTMMSNEKVKKTSVLAISLKDDNNKLTKTLKITKEELVSKTNTLRKSMERIDSQSKTIRDLRDVVDFREKELSKYKP